MDRGRRRDAHLLPRLHVGALRQQRPNQLQVAGNRGGDERRLSVLRRRRASRSAPASAILPRPCRAQVRPLPPSFHSPPTSPSPSESACVVSAACPRRRCHTTPLAMVYDFEISNHPSIHASVYLYIYHSIDRSVFPFVLHIHICTHVNCFFHFLEHTHTQTHTHTHIHVRGYHLLHTHTHIRTHARMHALPHTSNERAQMDMHIPSPPPPIHTHINTLHD
jgi:hypothetical protein